MRVDTREPRGSVREQNPEARVAAREQDPGKARYRQFVKQACERKQVWGLYRDGWALSRDANGETSFPLWADKDSAERDAKGPWRGYEAAEIPTQDLLEQLLPQLARDQVRTSLRGGSDEAPIVPSIAQLILDLEHELDPAAHEDEP
jgi:hypothetical protein